MKSLVTFVNENKNFEKQTWFTTYGYNRLTKNRFVRSMLDFIATEIDQPVYLGGYSTVEIGRLDNAKIRPVKGSDFIFVVQIGGMFAKPRKYAIITFTNSEFDKAEVDTYDSEEAAKIALDAKGVDRSEYKRLLF